jgi:hypothetical protein
MWKAETKQRALKNAVLWQSHVPLFMIELAEALSDILYNSAFPSHFQIITSVMVTGGEINGC